MNLCTCCRMIFALHMLMLFCIDLVPLYLVVWFGCIVIIRSSGFYSFGCPVSVYCTRLVWSYASVIFLPFSRHLNLLCFIETHFIQKKLYFHHGPILYSFISWNSEWEILYNCNHSCSVPRWKTLFGGIP